MKGKSVRDMEIIVLKNRNGKIGEELSFSYYAMFHHFYHFQESNKEKSTDKFLDDFQTDSTDIKII